MLTEDYFVLYNTRRTKQTYLKVKDFQEPSTRMDE